MRYPLQSPIRCPLAVLVIVIAVPPLITIRVVLEKAVGPVSYTHLTLPTKA